MMTIYAAVTDTRLHEPTAVAGMSAAPIADSNRA